MTDSLEPQSRCQSSESVKRVARLDPTDGRTKVRTKNLQDQGEIDQFLDAHEKSADPVIDPVRAAIYARGRALVDIALDEARTQPEGEHA